MSEVDLSDISVWFDGDPDLSARKWLERQREELEAVIEPCLRDHPTKFSMTFRGQKRYVDGDRTVMIGEGDAKGRISVIKLADALSYVYGISAAIQAGDMDAVVNKTYGFARCRAEIESVEIWGMRTTDALSAIRRNNIRQSERRKGKGILTPKEKELVLSFVRSEAKKLGAKKAAHLAADQLRTGTFKGIKRRIEDVEGGTIRSWLYPR